MVFSIVIGILLLLALLSPFFIGPGGALQAGAAVRDPEQLKKFKKAVLKQYIKDEQALAEDLITKTEWKQKSQFLVNRYIDASRRIDFLLAGSKEN